MKDDSEAPVLDGDTITVHRNHLRRARAAAIFVKLAKAMPIDMARRLATPGHGEKFWDVLEREWPRITLPKDRLRKDDAGLEIDAPLNVLQSLASALQEDREPEAARVLGLPCP